MVRLLLEEGADVNVPDTDGWTALRQAVEYGGEVTVWLLLERGGGCQRAGQKWKDGAAAGDAALG